MGIFNFQKAYFLTINANNNPNFTINLSNCVVEVIVDYDGNYTLNLTASYGITSFRKFSYFSFSGKWIVWAEIDDINYLQSQITQISSTWTPITTVSSILQIGTVHSARYHIINNSNVESRIFIHADLTITGAALPLICSIGNLPKQPKYSDFVVFASNFASIADRNTYHLQVSTNGSSSITIEVEALPGAGLLPFSKRIMFSGSYGF